MTRSPVPSGSTGPAPSQAPAPPAPPALPAPRAPESAGARAGAAPAPEVAGARPDAAALPDAGPRPDADALPDAGPRPDGGAPGGAGQVVEAEPAVRPAGQRGNIAAAAQPLALAGPWRRLAAFVIDALILTLATGALWGRLLASFANRMGNAASAQAADAPGARGAYGRVWGHTLAPYLIVLVPTIILAIVYYWLLTGYWGTTIGKRALGCWVTESDGRSPVSLRRSFLRALVFVAGGELVPPFFLADNAWLTTDARRQALHDKAGGTVVVRRPPRRTTTVSRL